MPNHVHLILVPSDADGLRRALAAVHRRYAGIVHARRRRTGHFWQRRFGAAVMDEAHLAAALRYVSLNPVRARLVERPQDWRWASTRAHLSGKHDGITARAPVKERISDFADFLAGAAETDLFSRLRTAESIGRPARRRSFSRPHRTLDRAPATAGQTWPEGGAAERNLMHCHRNDPLSP
jgi:putative transposase